MQRRLKQNERQLAPFSSRDFSRDGDMLVAEASTCGGPSLQQIYNDACDVGIAIRSERTGVVCRFLLVDHDENDGEVAGWRFEPLDKREAGRTCGIKRVLIIND